VDPGRFSKLFLVTDQNDNVIVVDFKESQTNKRIPIPLMPPESKQLKAAMA